MDLDQNFDVSVHSRQVNKHGRKVFGARDVEQQLFSADDVAVVQLERLQLVQLLAAGQFQLLEEVVQAGGIRFGQLLGLDRESVR